MTTLIVGQYYSVEVGKHGYIAKLRYLGQKLFGKKLDHFFMQVGPRGEDMSEVRITRKQENLITPII